MRDRIFYTICFGFLFGVLWRSFVPTPKGVGIPTESVGIFYITLLFIIITLALFLFFSLISKNRWGILISIFILAFCLGVFRFHIADLSASNSAGILADKMGQKISLSGEIIDEPNVGENSQKLTVSVTPQGLALDSLKARPSPAASILLSVGLDEDYKYGDEINFSGVLKKPENFMTDQGKEFDYINYLRKDGIFYVMSYPKIEIVSHGNGNWIKSALFFAKEKFLEKANFAIPSPESLLMSGLIFGEKSDFSQTLRQSFVNTGMIHLVTLSGYKVTMVAGWLMKLFAFLPKNLGLGMGILAIFLFLIMTGGSSTAIRAGIMAVLALFARATGRNYDVARALILTGVIMILLNPFVLVYDVSFQLSFIGTIAIIFLAPRMEKYFWWATSRFGLRDIITMTAAIYIFVFPFILYKMGSFSLVTLPANILILPLVPLTMLLIFLTGLVGLIWYVPAVPLGYISYLFLHYELGVVNFFSQLPLAAFSFSNFPLFLTIIIYAYFTYRLFGRSIKSFFTAPV
jgi:competence protein ComEC